MPFQENKVFKNHFLYLKIKFYLSEDKSLNPRPIHKNHLLKENWKAFKNDGRIKYN